MSRRVVPVVAVALAGVLLLLSGLLYPATVPHALHHAHHQAATHATALCSWLCAAGQMTESSVPVVGSEFRPIAWVSRQIADNPSTSPTYRPPSRAPPTFFS